MKIVIIEGGKRDSYKVTYWIETIHRFYGLLEAVSSWES